MKMMKSVPLKIIFKNLLETGIFPEWMEKGKLTPATRKKRQLITIFRPISLLPILAKVFEKIISRNLYH